uniref:Suppressor of cytokine signaling 7 n=1 Tax=Hippocampus comes TaxID=109280 RepID=A0A3Q2XC56_HIPCM
MPDPRAGCSEPARGNGTRTPEEVRRQLRDQMDGPVLKLARRFGELGVGAVPKMLLKAGELPRCACQGAHAPGEEPADDPAVTSDALLVLEGLGSDDVAGLGLQDQSPHDREPNRHFLVSAKPDLGDKISYFRAQVTVEEGLCGGRSPGVDPDPQDSPLVRSQASTPRRRPERCAGAPRNPCGGAKTLRASAKSKKRSLRVRMSRLFRTKSCSGSSHLLDRDHATPFGGLVDAHMSASGPSLDLDSAGETVSLLDVDLSRRGTANTPHPPTPPPPPRRSLSLLDAFLRALPHVNPAQADPPPASRQAPPPVLCALRRSEAGNFTASLRELEKCGWYWGPMNWEDAEMKLKGKPDGSFLVRDSSDPRYILSLSFRSQGVTHHTRMEHYRGTFSLWCHPKFEDRCHSVVEFIERAIMHSKNGKFLYFLRSRVPGLPPTPVQLLYPVSRFSNVKSLQHLCRFCIRQIVRIDHIQQLPLPRSLLSYLSKFYYYDPEEEMYPSVRSIRAALRAHT